MKVKRGDNVRVMVGKDRGKVSKVLKTFPEDNKLIIEKVNMVKRHMKRTATNTRAGIIEMEKPITDANVAIICANCNKPTRIGYEGKGKNKTRICLKCKKGVTK